MKCNRCEKEFSSKQRKDYHCNNVVCGAKHLGRLPTTFFCRMCGKMFTSNQKLQYHEDNLICKKQNKTCDKCGKTYTSLRNLRQHSCKKPIDLSCGFCGKTLSDKRRCLGHIKICKIKEKEMSSFISFGYYPSEDELISLLKRRKALNQTLPGFELTERVAWYEIDHWNEVCPICRVKRGSNRHVRLCLLPKRTTTTFI